MISFIHAWPKVALTVFLVSLLWHPAIARAGGLKDVIKNLYGGDGIKLLPGFDGEEGAPAHFIPASLAGLESLGSSLLSNVGFFAFNSAAAGFTFDIERGVPVRIERSLGPLLGERAPTLGARKLNVAFGYSRLDYTRFEGNRLNRLSLTVPHIDENQDGILSGTERDMIRLGLDLKIEQDVFALSATYGLTRSWDLGIVVPIVRTLIRVESEATIVCIDPNCPTRHQFGPGSDPPTDRGGGDKAGIGDVVLRSKYNFLRNQPAWPDLAILGQVKLATGDEDNLLGTGETNFLALLVASRSFGAVTPHVNLGYELTTAGPQGNNLRYVTGFDAELHRRLTFALDVVGRWEHNGDGIGDHIVDLALGAKVELRRALVVNANVQLPLNKNSGLRADAIWTVGVEYTF